MGIKHAPAAAKRSEQRPKQQVPSPMSGHQRIRTPAQARTKHGTRAARGARPALV